MSKRIDFLANAVDVGEAEREERIRLIFKVFHFIVKKAFLTIFQIGFYAPEALLYLVVVNDFLSSFSCFFP